MVTLHHRRDLFSRGYDFKAGGRAQASRVYCQYTWGETCKISYSFMNPNGLRNLRGPNTSREP